MSKYRVWYVPQVPMKAFVFDTDDLDVATIVLDVVQSFSLFEYDNRVKPDYCDAGGIAEWDEENQDWFDLDVEEEDE